MWMQWEGQMVAQRWQASQFSSAVSGSEIKACMPRYRGKGTIFSLGYSTVTFSPTK